VRRHLHLDYYYPDMTEDEKEREGPHIDHCLEYWREAAMCRADMALSTFYWNTTSTFPASRVYSDHECVDWERLDAWSRSRMFIINDKHDLQDPSQYRK
jgi:Mycotoxin biosynthesis protein UstYa